MTYYGKLTGGTGDVNPQWYRGTLTMTAPNIASTLAFISPIGKGIAAKTGSATVMEVLKVQFILPILSGVGAGAETVRFRTVGLSTRDHATTHLQGEEPDIIAYHTDSSVGAFTALQGYHLQVWATVEKDLTDGAGHGVLVATDYIYFQGDTDGFAAEGKFSFGILYRFKNVKLVEYIGIVQSQQ